MSTLKIADKLTYYNNERSKKLGYSLFQSRTDFFRAISNESISVKSVCAWIAVDQNRTKLRIKYWKTVIQNITYAPGSPLALSGKREKYTNFFSELRIFCSVSEPLLLTIEIRDDSIKLVKSPIDSWRRFKGFSQSAEIVHAINRININPTARSK